MTLDISLPALGRKVPKAMIALGGAVLAAALYLGDLATGLLLPLYSSIIGVPLVGLLMILPTLLVVGALFALARAVLWWPYAVAVALLPLFAWSFFHAPVKQAQILRIAEADGGELPAFEEHDVLAILDRTSPRHASKSHCTATCVEILRSGQLHAIFLPRFISADARETHGVIIRRTTFGRECQRELAPRGVRPICVSITPATLADTTYVLETYHLPFGNTAELGVHEGEQMRLTDLVTGEVLLQRTALEARVPSRLPILGDLRLAPKGARVEARMLTKDVSRTWSHPPLITMLWTRLDRRAAGFE